MGALSLGPTKGEGEDFHILRAPRNNEGGLIDQGPLFGNKIRQKRHSRVLQSLQADQKLFSKGRRDNGKMSQHIQTTFDR